MTDKELLELAAKAAGVSGLVTDGCMVINEAGKIWNPFDDDGDALRLAVALQLEIGFPNDHVVWSYGREGEVSSEQLANAPYAATRRAIVRTAAEIGKGKL